ncbi:hypothetical protein DFJ43DRAFT_25959 [Lentinula guzmanii]|uniref:Phosphatase 2A Regulatory Subunit A helical domain-containing protein n=1 Tax=Lentinula guzmanii TaxID=2804957 RepID=A0AA38JLK8_9AGAR|nr:hypothetical protein DFJ43DRAFT_25959 [Lentinula guzmanii]
MCGWQKFKGIYPAFDDLGLSDVEETVVAKVLAALTSICKLGLFQNIHARELMSATLGTLYHPNIWVQEGAAAVKHLSSSNVWRIPYPSLLHFLESELATIDNFFLLNTNEAHSRYWCVSTIL